VNEKPTYDPDLMRFLGSGYAPKAAQDSPKKPWRPEIEDRRAMREMGIKPE
jgi:hypothetical protein